MICMYKCEKDETCNFGEVSFMEISLYNKGRFANVAGNNVLLTNSITILFILLYRDKGIKLYKKLHQNRTFSKKKKRNDLAHDMCTTNSKTYGGLKVLYLCIVFKQ